VIPVVRYMLLCEDVRVDPVRPACTHIECLMSNIVSLEEPPYPLLLEMICVFLVLADCQGRGRVQIRVAFADEEQERPLFGSPEHEVDFSGTSPLEAVGIPFRLRDCRFPSAGTYTVQFWYNGVKIEDRTLRLR
jgi:hypothetical protein